MTILVEIMPKEGIYDPQGRAVQEALLQLGFKQVKKVNVGKLICLELETQSESEAREMVDAMAKKLLVNPNIEQHRVRGEG